MSDAIPSLKCSHCPDKKNKRIDANEKQEESTQKFDPKEHCYSVDLTKFVTKKVSLLQKELENSSKNVDQNCEELENSQVQESKCFHIEHNYAMKETLNVDKIESKNDKVQDENHICIRNTRKPKIFFNKEIFLSAKNKENVDPILSLETQKYVLESNNKMAKLKKELAACKRLVKKLSNDERLKWLEGNFSEKQIVAATTGKTRGRKWDTEDIKKGLQYKYVCGTTGYEKVAKNVIPMPSPRTLLRRIEHIKLEPGILTEVLQAFGPTVLQYKLEDRDCALFFDEMSIDSRREFDRNTKKYIGSVTLPEVGATEKDVDKRPRATKAQVYMIGGVRSHWKITAGYHFIGDVSYPKEVAKTILKLLYQMEAMNLNILALVCDMGNRDVLRELGFSTKKGEMIYCIKHPANSEKWLFVIPDVVHLFKSLKEMLINNRIIILPQFIVEIFKLSSNEVNLEWLEEYQRDDDLKFTPMLKKANLTKGGHFNKMKVGNSRSVINHKVGSALNYFAAEGCVSQNVDATAWFILFMNHWLELMTSRNLTLALSKNNKSAYEEAISHLKLVIWVMANIQVGEEGKWKPVQTHIMMATQAIIDIQEILLNERGYSFVQTAKFLNDIVENLFSIVRLQRPKPTPLQFKHRLRQIVISQLNEKVKNSSYDHDDRIDPVNLLLTTKGPGKKDEGATKEMLPISFQWKEPGGVAFFKKTQEDLLYRISGYVVKKLVDRKSIQCKDCIKAMSYQGPGYHPNSAWIQETNYDGLDRQFRVSDEIYQLFRKIEYNLLNWKETLLSTNQNVQVIAEAIISKGVEFHKLSTCHNVKSQLIKYYIQMRLRQFSEKKEDTGKASASQLASKSMGSRYLADLYKSSTKKPQLGSQFSVKMENPAEKSISQFVSKSTASQILPDRYKSSKSSLQRLLI